MVLSHDYWRNRFARDRDLVGKALLVNGHPMTIVGVAAPGFTGVSLGFRPDLYVPVKVVNRLREVTSAIRQSGANQVDVIGFAAEKEAAVEFSRAEAVRPRLVGQTLAEISRDQDVLQALL